MDQTATTPKSAPTVPTIHTIKEAAALLRVSERHVYTLTTSNELGHVRIGKRVFVSEADIKAFLCRNHHGPSAAQSS